MTKKSKIIGAALVSCLLIGGGGVYYANEQKKAEQERIYVEKINDQVDSISKDLAEFEKESEENKKFEQLKSLISEFEEYKNGDEKDEKIINKYQASIKTARQFFKEENEKQIEDSTPKELEKENISNLKDKTDALNKLNDKIKNQKEIVYSEQEIQELNEKIEKLLKDFSNRIKDLEKKEAEEKAAKKDKKYEEELKVFNEEVSRNVAVEKDTQQQSYTTNDSNFSHNYEQNDNDLVAPSLNIENHSGQGNPLTTHVTMHDDVNGGYTEYDVTNNGKGVTVTGPGGSTGGFN